MDMTQQLEGKPYDEMSEDELVWLKDHNRLPQDVELKYFRARPDGGAADVELGENTGDVGTKNAGFASGLQPSGVDLSGIDHAAEKEKELEKLRAQLAQAEAERDALLAANEEEDEEDFEEEDDLEDDRPYEDFTVAELHEEIDRRNADRAADDQLTKPAKKGAAIAVLEEDDDQ